MKKTAAVIIMLFVFFPTAFAGSIDMDLLNDDSSLVFIGSVDNYVITHEEQNYPDTEYTLTVTPTKKLKGVLTIGKPTEYKGVHTGKLKLEKNTSYLFGYMKNKLYVWELDEYNNLFDWEIDRYNEDSIILKERHNDSITQGMQKLLNDNSFVLAEQKLQSENEQTPSADMKPKLSAPIFIVTILFILLVLRRKNNA